MTLWLIRHGQTTRNVDKYLDTHLPGAPLTPHGIQQARDTGDALKDTPLVAVYASLADRARDTAAHIAAPHHLPVQQLQGIHEIQLGSLEMRNDSKAHRAFGELTVQWATGNTAAADPDGGESADDVVARFLPDLQRVADQHLRPDSPEPGQCAMVAHGAVIRLILGLMGAVSPEFSVRVPLRNCGIVQLELTEDTWVCHTFDGVPPDQHEFQPQPNW